VLPVLFASGVLEVVPVVLLGALEVVPEVVPEVVLGMVPDWSVLPDVAPVASGLVPGVVVVLGEVVLGEVVLVWSEDIVPVVPVLVPDVPVPVV